VPWDTEPRLRDEYVSPDSGGIGGSGRCCPVDGGLLPVQKFAGPSVVQGTGEAMATQFRAARKRTIREGSRVNAAMYNSGAFTNQRNVHSRSTRRPGTFAASFRSPRERLGMPVHDGPTDTAASATAVHVTPPEVPPPRHAQATRAPAFAWLTAAAVVATAVPVFVRLPFSVPGLQSLTPQKILLPLVVLALVHHLLRRRTGRVLTPLVCVAGGLFLWLLVSVLANRQYEFVYNVRAWSWLALDLGLLVAAQEMGTHRATRRLFGWSVFAAVVTVALIGFVELLNIPGMDRFFFLFRPNWLLLGLRGPGPDIVLPVHGFAGVRMALMSTLSNDAGWFLALGSVVLAAFCLFGDLRRPWTTRLAPAAIASGYLAALLALLLTLSRSSILVAGIGLVVLLGTASFSWPRLRRRALVIALTSFCLIVGQTFSNSVLRAKFFSLTSADVWTTGMVTSAPRAIPPEDRPLPASAGAPPPAAARPAPAAPATPPPAVSAPVAPPPTAAVQTAPGQARTTQSAGPTPPQPNGSAPTRSSTPAGERQGGARTFGGWSVTQRVLMARVAIAMVSQNPVFGVGFANFRTRLYEPGPYAAVFEVGDRIVDVQDPHDFFLWIAAAGGLPALLLVLLILGLSARTIIRAVARGGEDPAWAVTVGAVWLTLAGYMFMGFTLMTPASQAVFALLVGTTAAIERRQPPMGLPAR
jgi:hypothetical protein